MVATHRWWATGAARGGIGSSPCGQDTIFEKCATAHTAPSPRRTPPSPAPHALLMMMMSTEATKLKSRAQNSLPGASTMAAPKAANDYRWSLEFTASYPILCVPVRMCVQASKMSR